jgi:membrane associated rhomboid family serine protease
VALVSVILSAGYMSDVTDTWSAFSRWGCPSPDEVWNGKVWAPLTSVFVHSSTFQLVFDVCWFWPFSATAEKVFGRRVWILLFIAFVFLTYSSQLSVFGVGGHGLSGVACGFAALVCILDRQHNLLSGPKKVWLICSLIFCVLLAILPLLPTGTLIPFARSADAAHLSGIIAGSSFAILCMLKKEGFVKLLIIGGVLVALVPLVWAPWLSGWKANKAIAAFHGNDLKRAEQLYFDTLRMGEDPVWVWRSLAVVYWKQHDSKNLAKAISEVQRRDPALAGLMKQRMKIE